MSNESVYKVIEVIGTSEKSWEDAAVHKDSEETRRKALEMGANIIQYVFTE